MSDSSSSSSSSQSDEEKKKKKKKKKKKSKEKKKKTKKDGKSKKRDKKRKFTEMKSSTPIPVEEGGDAVDEHKEYKIGVPVLVSGTSYGMVEKTVTSLGNGRRPLRGQDVRVHAAGYLERNLATPFWTTRPQPRPPGAREGGEPFMFAVNIGRAIPGWDHGKLFFPEQFYIIPNLMYLSQA
jgi:hypothetical protein